MGLEFRQRGPSEYLHSLLRRKWLILLPAIAIAIAIAIAVMRLPNVYESSALLVVKPSSLGGSMPVTDPIDMTRKLNALKQIVISRTNLEQIIKKHGLYKEERARGISMDTLISRMEEKDVKFELNMQNEVINGFTIAAKARDPRTAKNVTEDLSGKCVSTIVEGAATDSRENERFFQEQRKKYEDEMATIERERLQYIQSKMDTLPTEQASLVEQLSGLRDQQKSIYNEIGRLRDQATLQANLMSAKQGQNKREIDIIDSDTTDISSYPVYAELVKERSKLNNDLEQLLKQFKPKHPDVISKKEQIANVEKEIERVRSEQEAKNEQRKARLKQSMSGESAEVATLRANIQVLENERKRQEALLGQVEREISSINQRLGGIPGTTVNLETIDRRFNTAKSNYDAIVEQQRKASVLTAANNSNRGESLMVQDNASLPQTPVAPKRPLVIGLGVAFGLGIGFLLAALAEAPRFFTIQTMDDAEHYTGLPVLVAVPELMTPEESTRRPRMRLAWLAAGLVVSLASIPILVKVLNVTHLFERFVL
jgi:polysaccharide chain length determinant protein (PEP-CTERM system associated)